MTAHGWTCWRNNKVRRYRDGLCTVMDLYLTVVRICFVHSDTLLLEFVSCSLIHRCQNSYPAVWYAVVRISFFQSDTLLSEFVSCGLIRCCQNLFPAVWYAVVRICFLQYDTLLSEFVSFSLIHCCQNLFPAVWYAVVRICFVQFDTLLSEFVSCSLIRCCQNLFPSVWYAVVRICFLRSDTLLSEFVSCSPIHISIKPSIALALNLLPSVLGRKKYLSRPFINLTAYLVYNETIMIWTLYSSSFSFHEVLFYCMYSVGLEPIDVQIAPL